GNPQELTVKDLAERVIRLTGSKSKLVHKELPQDDPARRCPDIARAKKLLGFNPRLGLDDGLKATIADFKSRIGTNA
ncbi:MAG: SDR family NAD-dependent epimerase/dehydratase, partial [Planctomycetes bacterium]|nr:SDR family NAD-dependent epimerase/dehydratase [Planctomycetota bacterium]